MINVYPHGRGVAIASLSLLGVLLAEGCASYHPGFKGMTPPSGVMYPIWFMETPSGGFAVGYSPPYHHEESSIQAAMRVGATALAAEECLFIEGGRGMILDALGAFLPGSDLREEVNESRIQALSKPEQLVVVARTEGLVIVLIARDGMADDVRQAFETRWQACPEEKPDWVTNLPKEDRYIYSVGVAMGYHHEASSWEVAERNARFGLAHAYSSQVKVRERQGEHQYESLSEINVKAHLRGVRIVKRWRDLKDGSCYVLARADRP